MSIEPSNTFVPEQSLAQQIIPFLPSHDDGSHDLAHLQRVWKNLLALMQHEGGDSRILLAAALLHDSVAVEKNSPLRAQASALAADYASDVLQKLAWSPTDIAAVAHAILTHSYSAGITPETLEARLLQDADRLDSLGMVGVARTFYIGGRMGSSLYNALDPLAQQRDYDDKRYIIDHFETKLFKLQAGFQTATGRQLAAHRCQRMRRFLDDFLDEI